MATDRNMAMELDSATAPVGWPAKSIVEIESELCAPGSRFELETVVIRGVEYRCWKHQHRNLVELGKAAGTGYRDREFIVYEDERVTYGGWFKAVTQLASHLMSLGIRKGDRVALAMRNYPEWPVAFFAGIATGAIIVPLNAWWSGPELRRGLAHSGSRILVCDAERLDRLAPELGSLPQLERIYVSRSEPDCGPKAFRLEEVIGAPGSYDRLPECPLPEVLVEPDDEATILYTSGTTGAPKGALATHRSNLAYILSAAYAVEQAARRRGDSLPSSLPPVLLSAVPLFHVTGLDVCLLPVIDAGGTLVMMRKWDASLALSLIEREKVTVSGGVPTIAWELLQHPDREKYDLSSLRTLFYGGAPSAPELAERIRRELKVSPTTGWGMTETCAVGTRHADEDYLSRPSSCGPANPGTKLQVVDPSSGDPLPVGMIGELWTKGPQIIKGYWDDPQATAETIQNGWLRTGDLARLDDDGFCYIVGRTKDLVIRGGENIYPIEIENVLLQHPAVNDVAVIGVAHKTLGEEPAAAVHLTPDTSVTEAELKAWVARHLAAFKVPVQISFFGSRLPRNANGKILKRELRSLLETQHG
jgi:acyl-CoA synthetase (AMP-forming)/AMP-acid ligase II